MNGYGVVKVHLTNSPHKRKEGREFLYSGYWKVYGNLEDTLKTFEAYDQARDYVIGMTGNGNEIRDILAAS